MRVGMVYGPGKLGVEEADMPVAGADDVVVRIRSAGICGSDLHYHRGEGEPTRRRAGGHELAGVVAEIGPDVSHVAVGDRVGVEPLLGCGTCRFCRAGNYHICNDLTHPGGGFGEYTMVKAENVFGIPDNVSDDAASVLDCVAVGVHAVQRAKTQATDTAVVLGDATIGLCTLQVAKANGAARVGVVGHHDGALAIAMELGADFVVNAKSENAAEAVMDHTGGLGADIVYESVGGVATTMETAQAVVRPGGVIAVIGSFRETPSLDFRRLLRYEVDVRFAWSYAMWNGVPEFKISIDMLADGRVRAEPMITHRFALDDIQSAFDACLDRYASGAVKVVINP